MLASTRWEGQHGAADLAIVIIHLPRLQQKVRSPPSAGIHRYYPFIRFLSVDASFPATKSFSFPLLITARYLAIIQIEKE